MTEGMARPVVLSAQQIMKSYQLGSQTIEILHEVNFEVRAQETVAIVGRSGVGKTTFLSILGGLEAPDSGKVMAGTASLYDKTMHERAMIRNEYFGFVYQFHHLLPEFTLLENVALPLMIRNISPKAATERARNLLEQVGLSERLSHKTGELSGGERQRAALARALVTEPKCLLADEPTGNLDDETAERIYELLLQFHQERQISLVVVTHDLQFASRMQRIFTIEKKQLHVSS